MIIADDQLLSYCTAFSSYNCCQCQRSEIRVAFSSHLLLILSEKVNNCRVAKGAAEDLEKAVVVARVEEKEVAKQQLEDLRVVKEKEREDAIVKLKVGISLNQKLLI